MEAYNASIGERVATFETEPHAIHDVAGFGSAVGEPFIVAEHDGWILGGA